MNEWELTLENVGCFIGNHTFKFKTGTNIVSGPNAAGKTSLLHAFKLLLPIEDYNNGVPRNTKEIPTYFLNSSSLTGSVGLVNGTEDYFVEFGRKSNGTVQINKKKLVSDNKDSGNLVFLSDNHELMEAVIKADFTLLRSWFINKTDLLHYERAYSISSKLDAVYRDEKDKKAKVYLNEKNRLRKEKKNFDVLFQEKRKILEHYQLEVIDEEADPRLLESFKNISQQLHEKKKEYRKLQLELRDLKDSIPEIKYQIEEVDHELHILSKDFISAKEKKETYESLIKTRVESIAQIIGMLKRKNSNKIMYEKDLSKLVSTLEKNHSECEHCGSKISKELLETRIEEFNSKISGLTEEIIEFDRSKIEETKKLEKYEKDYQDLTLGLPRKEKELKKQIQTHTKKLEITNNKYTGGKETYRNLKNDIQQLEEEYNTLNEQIMEHTDKNQELRNQINVIRGELNQLENQQASNQNDLSHNEEELKKLQIYDIWRRNINELKKFLQQNIISIQNNILDKINYHLKIVLDELHIPELKKIEFDDDFNIKILRKSGMTGEFEELSGLERRLIALIVGYSTKNALLGDFPLFIIDESLHSADAISFETIINYIGQKVELLIVTRADQSHNSERNVINQSNIKYWEVTP